jgi:hypothetical protein
MSVDILENIDIKAKLFVSKGKPIGERGKQWDQAVKDAIAKWTIHFQGYALTQQQANQAAQVAAQAKAAAHAAKIALHAQRMATFKAALSTGTAANMTQRQLIDYVISTIGDLEFADDYEILQEGTDQVLYSKVAQDDQEHRHPFTSISGAEWKKRQLIYYRLYNKYVREDEVGCLSELAS